MSTDLFTPEPEIEIQAIPDDAEIALTSIELETEPTVEIEAIAESSALVPRLVEILPAGFPLPALIKFVPNPALQAAATQAASYALAVTVEGAEGLQRADLALQALRASQMAILEHFKEPCEIANDLHRRLTSMRAEWLDPGTAALKTVAGRVYTEQQRLQAIADEERRKAQAEADRQAKEAARKEAEAAAKQQAPKEVVEELKRQAETATAPPVTSPKPAPTMRGSTTTTTWKARIVGTPGSDEPHPDIADLSVAQREKVLALHRAVADGKAPLAVFDLAWTYLDARARADKSTLAIPGIEAFESGGVRAKPGRRL